MIILLLAGIGSLVMIGLLRPKPPTLAPFIWLRFQRRADRSPQAVSADRRLLGDDSAAQGDVMDADSLHIIDIRVLELGDRDPIIAMDHRCGDRMRWDVLARPECILHEVEERPVCTPPDRVGKRGGGQGGAGQGWRLVTDQ
jgi:hypothetical protein